jgi:hypothetical protein
MLWLAGHFLGGVPEVETKLIWRNPAWRAIKTRYRGACLASVVLWVGYLTTEVLHRGIEVAPSVCSSQTAPKFQPRTLNRSQERLQLSYLRCGQQVRCVKGLSRLACTSAEIPGCTP